MNKLANLNIWHLEDFLSSVVSHVCVTSKLFSFVFFLRFEEHLHFFVCVNMCLSKAKLHVIKLTADFSNRLLDMQLWREGFKSTFVYCKSDIKLIVWYVLVCLILPPISIISFVYFYQSIYQSGGKLHGPNSSPR